MRSSTCTEKAGPGAFQLGSTIGRQVMGDSSPSPSSSPSASLDDVPKRVEEALFYRLKQRAFEDCDELARSYAACCSGRVVSLVWSCRDESKALSSCMTKVTSRLDDLKREWLRAGRKNEMQESDWDALLDRVLV